jgi:hypothetical protein
MFKILRQETPSHQGFSLLSAYTADRKYAEAIFKKTHVFKGFWCRFWCRIVP